MQFRLDKYEFGEGGAAEVYITAIPGGAVRYQGEAQELFAAVKEAVSSCGAKILQEKVFGTAEGLEMARKTRAGVYGGLDDGVEPSWLVCQEGDCGVIAGVQMHAVCGVEVETVAVEGVKCGRVVKRGKTAFLTLSGLSDGCFNGRREQAHGMLEKAGALLAKYGGDIGCVPRTWMWLGDILAWYDDFNRVRNAFFERAGAIGGGRCRMPASTGVGLRPANGCQCSMDLAAVIGGEIGYLEATARQKSAFLYGSAFSRASEAVTPGGRTVYVSGTAAIDVSGATTRVNDSAGQIEETIENVRAVLGKMGCGDGDVVQMTAYCKTAEEERLFKLRPESGLWPAVTVICDICRGDLLFEIEATAAKRQG